jgi:hypothetical protein
VGATLIKSIYRELTRATDALVARHGLSVLLIGLLAFASSVTIGLIQGIPEPRVHDEFSYLLAADTFAQGRLTNPTHPMWVHFESFHIFHQPSYMSKYPPGQGAILALGQLITGYPIVGVWLSMGLMCAAICWMLQAWVPARWALMGGLLALLHPIVGISGSWAQSYWGGAMAATGGALVLGGIRFALKEPHIHCGILTGVGLAILANTRPYEGLLVSNCAVVMLLLGLLRVNKPHWNLIFRRIVLPSVLTGAVTLAWMGYYNLRVTGKVFRLPYQVHQETYGVAPPFVWQEASATPFYRHARIAQFHTITELAFYIEKRTLAGFIQVNIREGFVYFALAINVLIIPLVLVSDRLPCWILRRRWAFAVFVTYTVFTMGLMLESYSNRHYWAPIVALNYYFALQALRFCRPRCRFLPAFTLLAMVSILTFQAFFSVWQKTVNRSEVLSAHVQRANLLARLEQLPGYHAVLVGYGPEQSIHREWVYNGADLDRAKVIWARDMDTSANCQFVNYFKDRNIWRLDVERDGVPVKLNPFPRQTCP